MKHLKHIIWLFLFSVLFFSGCYPLKKTPKGKYIIKKYEVNINPKNTKINSSDLAAYFPPKPNKTILGVWRLKLGAYYMGNRGKNNWLNRWLKNTIGEPPVFYDLSELKNSALQMNKFLHKKGYFNAQTIYTQKFRKRTANVSFYVDLGKPYTIRSVKYSIPDTGIRKYILRDTINSLIKPGDIYDEYLIDNESSRITENLRNNGFYYFSKDYILFEIDSNGMDKKMDIFIQIKNQNNINLPTTSKNIAYSKLPHQRFFINKIIINPDYKPLAKNLNSPDTVLVKVHQGKKEHASTYYYFVKNGKFKVKPKTITQAIFISEHEPFSLINLQRSYKRLNSLRIFRFTNIQFDTIIQHHTMADSVKKLLNCYISLQKAKRQFYKVEIEGTNSGGAFGLGGILNYQNKNIFRGAEVFNVRTFTTLQRIQISDDLNKGFFAFNNTEYGFNINLIFPNFLLPIRQERFPKFFEPNTAFNIGYTAQNRPSYNRFITTGSVNYSWKTSEYSKHSLVPVEINSIKVKGISSAQLDTLDPRTRVQFTNHLIVDTRYTYIFNNQSLTKQKNFFYIKTSIETSGNTLNLIDQASRGKKTEDGKYTIFGIQYSQYIRGDIDFTYYRYLTQKDVFAFRFYLGVGIPYSNSEAMPYEKAFVAGGANGMRGWGFRQLGPGSYAGTLNTNDRIGDMQLEGNFEYRFPIYGSLNGALFTDMGNIWLVRPSSSFPGGYFKFDSFAEEMAWDAGLGFRYDLNLINIRLDIAIRLRDPAKPRHNRWVLKNTSLRSLNYNFAIGLPF
ncbi:MAG: BamA/TamA family outer membrane protein [Bacteroidales bacterium]